MKFLICGKNEAALNTIKFLKKEFPDATIIFVYIEGEHFSRNEETLHECQISGIRAIPVENYVEFESLALDFVPNWIISAQFSFIFRRRLLSQFVNKIINIHFSPLPKYRGMAPITHALLRGEADFGITLHIVDDGVDTGPIICMINFSIRNLNNFEVYALCNKEVQGLLYASLPGLQAGEFSMLKNQDLAKATYFSKHQVDYTQLEINFQHSGNEIINYWRAKYFPPSVPQAIVSFQGKTEPIKLLIANVPRFIQESHEVSPGTFQASLQFQRIACKDGWIELNRLDWTALD